MSQAQDTLKAMGKNAIVSGIYNWGLNQMKAGVDMETVNVGSVTRYEGLGSKGIGRGLWLRAKTEPR